MANGLLPIAKAHVLKRNRQLRQNREPHQVSGVSLLLRRFKQSSQGQIERDICFVRPGSLIRSQAPPLTRTWYKKSSETTSWFQRGNTGSGTELSYDIPDKGTLGLWQSADLLLDKCTLLRERKPRRASPLQTFLPLPSSCEHIPSRKFKLNPMLMNIDTRHSRPSSARWRQKK